MPENADATDATPPYPAGMFADRLAREVVIRVVTDDPAQADEHVFGTGIVREIDMERPEVEVWGGDGFPRYEPGDLTHLRITLEAIPKPSARLIAGLPAEKVEALTGMLHETRRRRHIRATTPLTGPTGWAHCLHCQDRAIRMLQGSEGWRINVDLSGVEEAR